MKGYLFLLVLPNEVGGLIISVALFIFIFIIYKTQIANLNTSSNVTNNNNLLITFPDTVANKFKVLPFYLEK